MKLKRKIFLSTATIVAASTPLIVAISCSEKDKSGWNDTDSNISSSSAAIDINLNKELIFKGEDGKGTLQFQFKNGVIPMLSQANATLTVEIAKYKESTIAEDNYKKVLKINFSKLNKENKNETEKEQCVNDKLSSIKDLMVEDKVRVTVSTLMKGYDIKNIDPLNITGDKLKYEPLKPSEKLIDLAQTTITNKTLKVNLDKYKDKNLNDVMFSIASGMGMLFSEDINKTLGNKDLNKTFTPTMLLKMMKQMKARDVEKIEFTYTDKSGVKKTGTFNLNEIASANSSTSGLNTNKTINEKLDHILNELDKVFRPITIKTIKQPKVEDKQPKMAAKRTEAANIKAIEAKFIAASVEKNQYVNGTEIATEINNAQTIKEKLTILDKWSDVSLAEKRNGTTIKSLKAKADANGQITIEIKTSTTINKETVEKNVSVSLKGKADAEITKLTATEIEKFKTNIESRTKVWTEIKKIKDAVDSIKIDNKKDSAKIVGEINKTSVNDSIVALSKLGVNLTKLNNGVEITKITASSIGDGKINLTIKTSSNNTINGLLIGRTNQQIQDINTIDANQTISMEDIKTAFASKKVTQGFRYLRDIADNINGATNVSERITLVNNLLKANLLADYKGTKIVDIEATTTPTGEITFKIITNTLGATIEEKSESITIGDNKTDSEITSDIINEVESKSTLDEKIATIKKIIGIDIKKHQIDINKVEGDVIKIELIEDQNNKGEVVINVSVKDTNEKELKVEKVLDKVDDKIKRLLKNSKLSERYKEILEPMNKDLLLLIANLWDEKNSDTEALESLIDLAVTYSDLFNKLKEWDFFKGWVEQTRMRNLDKIDSILIATILRR